MIVRWRNTCRVSLGDDDGGIEVDEKTGLAADDLLTIIDGYDGLAVRSATKVTGELLAAASNLRVVTPQEITSAAFGSSPPETPAFNS